MYQVDMPEHLPHVAVPARTIDQAVINLAINARDAMPEGGTIEVSAEVSAGFVVLHIRDHGPGMDEATQEKIFEPFFTTKTSGTGLGLAVVFGLLQQAQGRIEVESVVGEGTHFSLYLPVSKQSSSQEAVATPRVGPRKESGQVMLVDDQASVRRMTRRILERAGYSVIEACNGQEALDLLSEDQGVKLLITDVRMPVLGGEELAKELVRRKRYVPVLFITGFAGDSGAATRLHEMGTVLRKPFDPAELLNAAALVVGAA